VNPQCLYHISWCLCHPQCLGQVSTSWAMESELKNVEISDGLHRQDCRLFKR
jgi:hypothetical protein